jgi:hypothetical protein
MARRPFQLIGTRTRFQCSKREPRFCFINRVKLSSKKSLTLRGPLPHVQNPVDTLLQVASIWSRARRCFWAVELA